MKLPIDHARSVCVALVSAALAMITTTVAASPDAPPSVQTHVHSLNGHRVTLDVHPVAGPVRGAAILSHGFTRSRRTLAGHARALADAGVLALTPDLPCTFDFRCNARALAELVGLLRAGGAFGGPVEKVMLVGFSAGGLSSLLAADTPGVVGFVGLDPFDRAMAGETELLGLAAASRLRTEALLLRAPPSRCNAEAVAAPWSTVLPALARRPDRGRYALRLRVAHRLDVPPRVRWHRPGAPAARASGTAGRLCALDALIRARP